MVDQALSCPRLALSGPNWAPAPIPDRRHKSGLVPSETALEPAGRVIDRLAEAAAP